jgi:hypothetical protein
MGVKFPVVWEVDYEKSMRAGPKHSCAQVSAAEIGTASAAE